MYEVNPKTGRCGWRVYMFKMIVCLREHSEFLFLNERQEAQGMSSEGYYIQLLNHFLCGRQKQRKAITNWGVGDANRIEQN